LLGLLRNKPKLHQTEVNHKIQEIQNITTLFSNGPLVWLTSPSNMMLDETYPPTPPGEDSCLLPLAGKTTSEEVTAATSSGDRTATMDSLFFLAVSCLAALLQDANEVVFLTLLQPAAWLAFAAAATTTTTTTTTSVYPPFVIS
jgi:hypothetical protein